MAPICTLCSTPCDQMCSNCWKAHYCSIEHQKEDWKRHGKECYPFIIGTHPVKGNRMLIATKNLKPYDLLLVENSLVNLPNSGDSKGVIVDTCISCLIEVGAKNIKPCSKCGWPVCGTQCENDKIHADYECAVFSKNKVRPDTINADLTLQLTRCMMLKKNDPEKFRALLNLDSKLEERKSDKLFNFQFKSAVWPLMGKCCEELGDPFEILTVLGVRSTNALLQLTDIENRRRASSHLYAITCLANHSCVPNAKQIVFQSGKLHLIATKEIKYGEEITLSYIALIDGNLRRRESCRNPYRILCQCERCLDPTELGTHFSSIKCGKCPNGFVIPKVNGSNKDVIDWICQSCSKTKLHRDVASMLYKTRNELYAFLEEYVFNQKHIRKYEAMREKCEQILHPNHHLILDLEYDFGDFLQKYYEKETSGKKRTQIREKLVKIGLKLMPILDKISPGPMLFRGRVLYFLSIGLCNTAVMDKIAEGKKAAQMANKKTQAKNPTFQDQNPVAKFKRVAAEALAILELEPPEAEGDHMFASKLREQLKYLS